MSEHDQNIPHIRTYDAHLETSQTVIALHGITQPLLYNTTQMGSHNKGLCNIIVRRSSA
jgi:hypothetical protein